MFGCFTRSEITLALLPAQPANTGKKKEEETLKKRFVVV
jgi:hypothetical protein